MTVYNYPDYWYDRNYSVASSLQLNIVNIKLTVTNQIA